MSESDWAHIEAFPSVLRLLYNRGLRQELWTNLDRLDGLEAIHFHRVIDNAPIEMSAEDFWVQLNYQLIHLIDFLPVSNWSVHANDTAFIIFATCMHSSKKPDLRRGCHINPQRAHVPLRMKSRV